MKLKINSLTKNVFKLSFGTIIGQIISLLSLPIFTRIYGAEIIGEWAIINSIATILNSFSDLGLINSIMVEDDENKALVIYKVVTTTTIAICFISIIIYVLYQIVVVELSIGVLFKAIILFLWALTQQQIQICYTWLNRQKQYSVLMKNPIINNFLLLLSALLFYMFGLRKYGYFISMIIGQLFTLLHMKLKLPSGFITLKITDYKYTLKKYKQFIYYQLPTTIILQIKVQLPTLLIGSFFGNEILGYYSVAMRVLNMPITFLANSVGRVYFQKASELKESIYEVGKFTLKSLNYAMKIGLIPLALIMAIADIFFVIVFGKNYSIAGNFTRIMAYYGFFMFLSMCTNGVAIVLNKQYYALFSGVGQIISIVLSFIIGKYINSPYIALFIMSISYVIIQIIYFCYIFKYTNIHIKRYLRQVIISTILIFLVYLIIRLILFQCKIVNSF